MGKRLRPKPKFEITNEQLKKIVEIVGSDKFVLSVNAPDGEGNALCIYNMNPLHVYAISEKIKEVAKNSIDQQIKKPREAKEIR